MITHHGRGTRAMQLLAVRLIELRDPNDALVLGDAMQEHGISGLLTGRSRPVRFRTSAGRLEPGSPRSYRSGNLSRITSDPEFEMIMRTRWDAPSFFVQGFETIYNVRSFAAAPTKETWGNIWSQWITPKRSMYRALVDSEILPRSIRPRTIEWVENIGFSDPALLSYALYLVRVPNKRKRPLRSAMFDIHRLEDDNPRTEGGHFNQYHPVAGYSEHP